MVRDNKLPLREATSVMRTNTKAQQQRETQQQREKRLARNRKARERHWRKTGVSSGTISWMKAGGWL